MSDVTWSASMPEVYDRCLGPALFVPFAEQLAGRAAARQPRTVLEVGAGTGIVTAALRQALPEADIVATDLNPAMVELAAARVPDVRWQQADAQQLPFSDGSLDLVVSSFTVMFLPDRVAAYVGIRRLLSGGGCFLFTVWDTVATNTLTAAMMRAVARVLPEDTPDFVSRIPHGYADPQRIRADLTAAGYGSVDIEAVTLPTTAGSAAQIAEGFCFGSPLRFALAERGDLAELAAAVAAAMTDELGPGEVSGELAAFVVTAT